MDSDSGSDVPVDDSLEPQITEEEVIPSTSVEPEVIELSDSDQCLSTELVTDSDYHFKYSHFNLCKQMCDQYITYHCVNMERTDRYMRNQKWLCTPTKSLGYFIDKILGQFNRNTLKIICGE